MNKVYFKEINKGNERIGFKIEKDAYYVYIPKYYLSNDELNNFNNKTKKKLKKLFKAWEKYQKNVKSILGLCNQKNRGEYDLNIAFNILQDYIENGLYIEQEKILKKSNFGKMDFKNTLKKCRPLYTMQGPIYLEYISKAKRENNNSTLRNIQCLILNDIAEKIGWILGIGFKFNIDENIKLNSDIIRRLKEIQMQTFNSRKLNLVDMFLKYINNIGNSIKEGKEVFVGVANLFWQDVINEVLGNVNKKELSKYFYVRHVFVSEKNIDNVMAPLMPDTVFKDNKNLIVIDSKYYLNGNLPTNDDINKQFIYMLKAYKMYPNQDNYQNCFVLPTNESSYLEKIKINFDADIEDPELMPIRIIYANVEEMINDYVFGMKNTDILQDLMLN